MQKSPSAFRTISEVGEILGIPAHVLRFWESKFTQIKPVKRGGGRRYYRPEDVALIRTVQHLLHEQGMTIKGAQKVLRERGVKAIIAMGQDLLNNVPAPGVVSTAVPQAVVAPPSPKNPQLKTIYLRLLEMQKSIKAQIAELA
ncbi:MAG: MerR family transcriptional regulator [Rhodobacteraceae bacterium]|nr:MerR family transcriptional regulator [Paracoccaceae bacterium]